MRRQRGARRQVESSAVASIAPLLAVIPVWLLAIAVFWLPVHLVWDVSYLVFAGIYLAAVVVLFLRPFQLYVLAPLLGARRPTADEAALLDTAWRPVLQVNDLPRRRYVLAVLPSNELNAFACGGHLVVVTSYAIEALPRDELSGVLAHELSHHLGLHVVALTVSQWLSVPVLLLARIGFFLQNVASAATTSFVQHSSSLTALGRLAAAVLTAISWVFLSGLLLSNLLSNAVGRNAEFQADHRAVQMGFGRPLSMALRRVLTDFGSDRATSWGDKLHMSHPPARTRVARIEAQLRAKR
jgi:Zn-dependent protease with chaperone function